MARIGGLSRFEADERLVLTPERTGIGRGILKSPNACEGAVERLAKLGILFNKSILDVSKGFGGRRSGVLCLV